jgi:hypothetical protein
MRRLACAAVALAACTGPPATSIDRFEWQLELEDLDEAVLSVWVAPDGSQAVATGSSHGDPFILEWDGGDTWRSPVLPDGGGILWWTWGDGGDTTFAVGEQASILRRGGGLWRLEAVAGAAPPQVKFYGVWGASADDVWVVGGAFPGAPAAAIVHWNGVEWTSEDPGDAELLFKVWGNGPDDVWAVGAGGTVIHRGGDAVWRAVDSGTTEQLIAVMGRGRDEVYAVGGDAGGVVLAWDGAEWTRFASEPEPLSGIWTAPGRSLFVGGNRGLLVRYGARDESDPFAPAATWIRRDPEVDFHCLSGGGDLVLAVGADIQGGGGGHWGGAVAAHGGSTARSIEYAPRPDAGPVDAAPPDASMSPIDGAPADARWPGHGEECGFSDAGIPICAAGLECWLLATSGVYMCTKPCDSAAECGEYGPSACCRRPGFQTLTTVCIPDGYVECSL